MKQSSRIMETLAGFVSRRYKLIVLLAVILVVLSLIAAGNIEVKTQIKDLLPESNPMVKSFLDVDEKFSGGESIFVLIEGSNRERMEQCAETLAARLAEDPEVMRDIRSINLKDEREFIADWGLLLQEVDDLEKMEEVFTSSNLAEFLTRLNDSFESTYTADSTEEELSSNTQEAETVVLYQQMEQFFTTLYDYLENPGANTAGDTAKSLTETFFLGSEYAYSWDNSLLIFTMAPDISMTDIEGTIRVMDNIDPIAAEIDREFPDVRIGFTGNIPLNADEQDYMSFDMLIPSLVAIVIIILLFLFSISQLRTILFMIIALVSGIILDFGFIGMTVKEITTLTSFMSTLLIGLGIDYGIQIVTNFLAYRREGNEPEEALRLTYQKAGTGTFLAALTTAVAFFVMAATGSKAFAQFGLVAGTGILCTFLMMFFFLPALMIWFGRRKARTSHIPQINYGFLGRIGTYAGSHRLITLAAVIVITVIMVFSLATIEFEHDLMKLEPQSMPSLQAYYRMMDTFGITPSASMVITSSIEEDRELTEKLKDEPFVAQVVSLSQYLPPADEQAVRQEYLSGLHRRISAPHPLDYGGTALEDLLYEIQRVEWNLIEIGDLSVAGLGEDNKIVKKRNRMIREVLGAEVGAPGDEVIQRVIQLIESDPDRFGRLISRLDESFSNELRGITNRMTGIDRQLRLEDLPESAVQQMYNPGSGEYLITIFPEDGMVNSIESMRSFNTHLNSVSPKITGSTQFLIEWVDESMQSSQKAIILLFIFVIATMIIDFRSLRFALTASLPLVFGMVWMFGLYRLFGLKLNAINIAVVPLVIGMGIDFGIHIVHRYLVEGDIKRTYLLTGKAIFLSGMTTMIGFGSLALIGSFKSISLIGAILFCGIFSVLLATYIILPPLLTGKTQFTGIKEIKHEN